MLATPYARKHERFKCRGVQISRVLSRDGARPHVPGQRARKRRSICLALVHRSLLEEPYCFRTTSRSGDSLFSCFSQTLPCGYLRPVIPYDTPPLDLGSATPNLNYLPTSITDQSLNTPIHHHTPHVLREHTMPT